MNIANLIPIQTGIGILDFASSTPILRPSIGKILEHFAYHKLVEENSCDYPEQVQRDKAAMTMALINSIERGLSRGLIGASPRHKLAEVFLGKIMFKPVEARRRFIEEHTISPPGFITISPTACCNLKCQGCYAASDAAQRATLPFEVFDRILKEKVELWGSHFTVISGGEPFLYRDGVNTLLDVFERHSDQYFLVYTNGTLITADVAKRLAELGNVTLAISVEGLERETDGRRGKGVFKRILNAFDNLRQAGVPFGISATATRDNFSRILDDEFVNFFFEQQGALYEWIFQYMPIGRGFTLETMVTPEQRIKMYERTWELIRKRRLFIADFWNTGSASNGCISAGGGNGEGYLYIDWNGSVAPCVFNPFCVHNIKEVYAAGGDLNTVVLSPLFTKIRQWQKDYFYERPNHEKGNLIAPCPYRDHHREMRAIIDKVHAQPIDENGRLALEDSMYGEGMMEYGKEFSRLSDAIWETRYLEQERKNHG